MLNKIYLLLLVAGVIVMSAVAYLMRSQLQSIGFDPRLIVAAFESYASAFWSFLGVSFAALLIAGNVILWKFRNSWALWTSLGFFAVFALAKTFWLSGQLYDYETEKNLTHSAPFVSYFTGVLLCAAAAAIVFFDHFLVLRMRDKIHGELAADESSNAAIVTENNSLSPQSEKSVADDETLDGEK